MLRDALLRNAPQHEAGIGTAGRKREARFTQKVRQSIGKAKPRLYAGVFVHARSILRSFPRKSAKRVLAQAGTQKHKTPRSEMGAAFGLLARA